MDNDMTAIVKCQYYLTFLLCDCFDRKESCNLYCLRQVAFTLLSVCVLIFFDTWQVVTMPQIILLFSGKRKSGKDFLTTHLQKLLGERCDVIKISQPIKSYWAKEKNLNLNELLSDSEYKEQYRIDMINWSDEMRAQDYGYFCKLACQDATEKPIWIVSDIRRKTDIQWFKETYRDIIRTIRITADDNTRKERSFIFKPGVDDVTSECDLDDYTEWNLVIDNGKGKQKLEEQLGSILGLLSNL